MLLTAVLFTKTEAPERNWGDGETNLTNPPLLETAKWLVSPLYVEFETITLAFPFKFLRKPVDNENVAGVF